MLLTVKVPPKLSTPRSELWPKFRAGWIKNQPSCQVCDRTKKLEVHHIIPFHINPRLELDVTNLITLCEHPAACCHYIVGHCALSWLNYDPNVIQNAKIIRAMRLMAK
jgi:hypothetical protein